MRKPTQSEIIFLAVIAATASLATVEVFPKVVIVFQKRAAIVKAELNRKNSIDPKDAFSTGLVFGLGFGALGATKIIADKINYP